MAQTARREIAQDTSPEPARAAKPPKRAALRELNRLEVLRGLRIAIWEAAFATVWATLTTGAFLIGFALWLGASDVAVGFLTAIPTFAGLIQLVSSYFGERWRERKPFVAWFSVAGRALWLPILLLPLLLPPAAALYPFLLLFALSHILLNVPAPAAMSWMSDLVPPDHRGRYFGRRNMIAGLVGMGVGLPAAWFLDFATKQRPWETLGFGTLFGVAVLGGLASFICLLRQPEPPRRAAPREETASGLAGILAYYRAPFADPNFRRLMLFNAVFGLGQNFALPFFSVYALKVLKLDYIYLQLFAVLTGVATLGAMPLYGYLADKFGNRPLLVISVWGVFTLPFFWIPCVPGELLRTLAIIGLGGSLMGGFFWSGVVLTQFNLLIRLSPPERTPIYVATMAAVTGLVGGLAPLAGSALMEALSGWQGELFGLTLSNFHITFAVAGLLRLSSLVFLRQVEDTQAISTRDVLRQLGKANLRAWRHIRSLQSGGDEEAKLRATEALAEARTQLAVAELKAALSDPSLAVREEAARALGEIRDPAAVEALLEALRDPAAGLVDEAAQALGRIGDRRAVPALTALLQDGELTRRDRAFVVRALGEIGGPEARKALLARLRATFDSRPFDEGLAETTITALGKVGGTEAARALADCLRSPNLTRGLRLALTRALGEIADPTTQEALRTLLPFTDNDPALLSVLSDALARVHDTDSIPELLRRLARTESIVARKQVASAIGTLIGESESVYSLLALEEFARDTAVTKLLQELSRRQKKGVVADALGAFEAAYIGGDYRGCVRALRAGLPEADEPPQRAEEDSPRLLCRAVLETLADDDSPPAEAVLLALVAYRAFLAG